MEADVVLQPPIIDKVVIDVIDSTFERNTKSSYPPLIITGD